MPSPFPGMDPYIESPELWSDFHNDLASEIRAHLNRHIQPRYFARLTPYVTYEVVEIGQAYGVRPDVGLAPRAGAGRVCARHGNNLSSAGRKPGGAGDPLAFPSRRGPHHGPATVSDGY